MARSPSDHSRRALLPGPQGGQLPTAMRGTRLVAGRKVSRHPIADICCLPVVQRVVARGEDGAAWVRTHGESASSGCSWAVHSGTLADRTHALH